MAFFYLMMTAGITFFLSSGLPFLTEARNMSPAEPAGNLFNLEPIPTQAIMWRFLAPVLSAQFITQATGMELVILTLVPDLDPLPIQFNKVIIITVSQVCDSFESSVRIRFPYLFCS